MMHPEDTPDTARCVFQILPPFMYYIYHELLVPMYDTDACSAMRYRSKSILISERNGSEIMDFEGGGG
jgi:hypothetical protein